MSARMRVVSLVAGSGASALKNFLQRRQSDCNVKVLFSFSSVHTLGMTSCTSWVVEVIFTPVLYDHEMVPQAKLLRRT
jgi:hypothetical protein